MQSRTEMAKAELRRRNAQAELERRAQEKVSEEKQTEKPSAMDIVKKSIDVLDAPRRAVNRAGTNLGAGMASAAENVYATVPELMGHEIPRHDWAKMAGVEDQNTGDKILQGLGKAIPAAAAAPLGFWPGVAGAGAYGFTQVEPGEQGLIDRWAGFKPDTGITGRLRNATEDALLGMLGGGVAKGLAKGLQTKLGKSVLDKLTGNKEVPNPAEAFKVEAKFGEPEGLPGYTYKDNLNAGHEDLNLGPSKYVTEGGATLNPNVNNRIQFNEDASQFHNRPSEMDSSLDFLRQGDLVPEVPQLSQESASPLHGVETSQVPSRSGSMSENVYDYLSGGRNLDEAAKYNASHMKSTFERLEGIGNKKYDNIFKSPEFLDTYGEPQKFDSLLGDKKKWIDFADHENKQVFEDFVENPTLANAQKAKSELAVEKREFQKIARTLTPEQKIQYKDIIQKHDALERDMNNIIKTNAPHLKDELGNANQYWAHNVANWYDKPLFRIVKGRETNPSSSTIAGIFRNPEPGISRVVNELGEEGKKGILLHGIGKAKGNYSPQILENILPGLEEKGLLPHITPQFKTHIGGLKQQIKSEKQLADAILSHEKETKRIAIENKAKLSAYEKQSNEHVRKKEMREKLIEKIKTAEPIVPEKKQIPGYKFREESYPSAKEESGKIVAKAGKKHEELTEALNKHMQKVEEEKIIAAERKKQKAKEMAADIAITAISPKVGLARRVLRTIQRRY